MKIFQHNLTELKKKLTQLPQIIDFTMTSFPMYNFYNSSATRSMLFHYNIMHVHPKNARAFITTNILSYKPHRAPNNGYHRAGCSDNYALETRHNFFSITTVDPLQSFCSARFIYPYYFWRLLSFSHNRPRAWSALNWPHFYSRTMSRDDLIPIEKSNCR